MKHSAFAIFVVFIIALPNFVCKVSDEEFKKFKDDYVDKKVKWVDLGESYDWWGKGKKE